MKRTFTQASALDFEHMGFRFLFVFEVISSPQIVPISEVCLRSRKESPHATSHGHPVPAKAQAIAPQSPPVK